MKKVKTISRLAEGKPHGCNVGIFLKYEAVARAAALFIGIRSNFVTLKEKSYKGEMDA